MTPEELLTTTRSVRRRLDLSRPVPAALINECVEIAVQAPSAGNRQGWQWLIVTDADKRRLIGDRYRESWYAYANEQAAAAAAAGGPGYAEGDPRLAQTMRIVTSARYLADHMHEVPVMVIPCMEGRVEGRPNMTVAGLYGSIAPAAWSFMLAARLRGLGSSYTTLHLRYEQEIAEALGMDYARYTQAALLPVAYFTGQSFQPVDRIPLESITHWERW
jgi:nitroreductase